MGTMVFQKSVPLMLGMKGREGGRWNIKSARRGLGDHCVGCWQGSDGKTEMYESPVSLNSVCLNSYTKT